MRLAAVADPVERLIELGMAYVRFGLEHPQHYRLLFMTPGAKREHPDDHAAAGRAESRRATRTASSARRWREAIARRGDFAATMAMPERVSQICWAATHGLISLHMVFAEDAWIEWRDVETSAERMLAALVDGMT